MIEYEHQQELHYKGKNNKKNKQRKKKVRPHGKEIIAARAMQNLCAGYYKVRTHRIKKIFFLQNKI